jgi:hypothetical protein
MQLVVRKVNFPSLLACVIPGLGALREANFPSLLVGIIPGLGAPVKLPEWLLLEEKLYQHISSSRSFLESRITL